MIEGGDRFYFLHTDFEMCVRHFMGGEGEREEDRIHASGNTGINIDM